MKHYCYLARCSDGTLYTGYTLDIEKRENMHNTGKGAKFTAGRRPVKIVYWEEFETKRSAMQREIEIKKWKREKKEQLIDGTL
ncbi:GIY-YIG nuclease family protein [Candidatus Gracilibacteria bacterium]|nr:GIY-YIG nuclease family protein [Candidatus Gracilibacteria bacterium]